MALVVPGVGDGTNMCDDWIPGAMNLYAAAPDTAVVLWKGYDNPLDLFDAATESIECNADLMTAGSDLVAFVDWLDLSDDQTPDGGGPQFRVGGDGHRAGRLRIAAAPTWSWPAARA